MKLLQSDCYVIWDNMLQTHRLLGSVKMYINERIMLRSGAFLPTNLSGISNHVPSKQQGVKAGAK